MTARPIRYQRQVSDRNGKIFYTSIASLSHINKSCSNVVRNKKCLLYYWHIMYLHFCFAFIITVYPFVSLLSRSIQ